MAQANVGALPGPAVNDNGGFVIRTDAAGRPLPRVGGLKVSEIKGEDGLR